MNIETNLCLPSARSLGSLPACGASTRAEAGFSVSKMKIKHSLDYHRHFLNKKGYARLVSKAKEFMHSLMGDSGYTDVETNRVALESMLIGWLRSTKEWTAYDKDCRQNHPRTDVYVVAQDQAVQAAHDAIFAEPGEFVTWFYTEKDLNAIIHQTPPLLKTRLAAKIAKAKKRLRISNFRRQAEGFTATIG